MQVSQNPLSSEDTFIKVESKKSRKRKAEQMETDANSTEPHSIEPNANNPSIVHHFKPLKEKTSVCIQL